METLKEGTLGIGRTLFEANGKYSMTEKENYFVIKNDECCRAIVVKVRRNR